MPTQISVSVLFLTTRRTDEHEGKIREPKCLIFRNAAGIRTGRYCKFTLIRGIAVVELHCCISLTVTEYDIDSVTCEMVRMVSSYGDQSTTRE